MSYPPVPQEFLATENAQERNSSLLTLLGVVLGIFVGALTCATLVRVIGPLYYGPKYAELAGLLLLISFITGSFFGAIVGAVTINRSLPLFLVTIFPVAVLFAVWLTTVHTLKAIDRPRDFMLQIEGTQGARFVGAVIENGHTHPLSGTLPTVTRYQGQELEFAVALVEPKLKDEIFVVIFADGRKIHFGPHTSTGLYQTVRSSGYSESVSRSSAGWRRLTKTEAKKFVADSEMPRNPPYRIEPGDF